MKKKTNAKKLLAGNKSKAVGYVMKASAKPCVLRSAIVVSSSLARYPSILNTANPAKKDVHALTVGMSQASVKRS